jgi:uncharacterized membrane protein
MKNNKWLFPLILLAASLIYLTLSRVQLPGNGFSTFGAGTVRAEVTKIIEEGEVELGGHTQTYQIARVKILEGEYAGVPMEIDFGKRQIRSNDYLLAVGDKVIVSISKNQDNVVNAYFMDFVRETPILWLTIIFAAAIILISAWKGVRALLSMAFSLYVIIGYIIPHILIGEDPLRVSIIGSAILLGVTLYPVTE